MEVRKVFKAGNSLVLSLPAGMLKSLNVREGDHVAVDINHERGELILKPVVLKKTDLSLDFVRLVDKVMLDFDHILRRL